MVKNSKRMLMFILTKHPSGISQHGTSQ